MISVTRILTARQMRKGALEGRWLYEVSTQTLEVTGRAKNEKEKNKAYWIRT